jgi:hypothetical protein
LISFIIDRINWFRFFGSYIVLFGQLLSIHRNSWCLFFLYNHYFLVIFFYLKKFLLFSFCALCYYKVNLYLIIYNLNFIFIFIYKNLRHLCGYTYFGCFFLLFLIKIKFYLMPFLQNHYLEHFVNERKNSKLTLFWVGLGWLMAFYFF